MKKLFLPIVLMMCTIFTNAQTSFDQKISAKSESLKGAKTATDFDNIYNEFSTLRMEKNVNRWKAYYYAGLTQYKKGEFLLSKGMNESVAESNALAFKNTMGAFTSQQQNQDIQNLLKSIDIQRKKIKNNSNILTQR